MIQSTSENFCTLGLHRGVAQGADLGGSEGAKYSYWQLQQWFLGGQNHTVHINQIYKINFKYQKLISEFILS